MGSLGRLTVVLILEIVVFNAELSEACTTYPCGSCRTSGSTRSYYCVKETYYEREGYDCGFWDWATCYRSSSRTRYVQRSCDASCCSGYSVQSGQCRDVNECSSNKGGCAHNCHNTAGGYYCSCNAGYRLNGNGRSCDDINECSENTDGCAHNCHNNVGSFTCSCNNGYRLNGNGKSCDDIDECALNTDGCDSNSECENSAGSFSCACHSGYKLSTSSRTTCVDIDECASDSTNQCAHNCHNDVGSYHCSCNTGYQLSGSYQCVDIDECTSQDHPHDCASGCVNTVGSFTCTCLTGYRLSGRTQCVDIDECTESSPCDHNCMNTDGSYTCSCNTGFSLMGKTTCVDIDECDETPEPCNQNCHNNIGSYTCSCDVGYNLVGGSQCQDIDECSTSNGGCSHDCSNQVGSYQCSCNSGYILRPDRHNCEEFNPLNPPAVQPSDNSFIGVIQHHLLGGCGSNLCSCASMMFTALTPTYGTTSGLYTLNLLSTNLKPAGDLMYAIFGPSTTLALPIAANLMQMSFDCSRTELTAVTFQTDKQMRFYPNIVVINNVYTSFKISFAGSSHTLSYLALIGETSLGGKTFTTTLDLTDSSIWYISTTLSGSLNVIQYMQDSFDREIPSTTLGAITLNDASLRGSINIADGYKLVLAFGGTGQIDSWFTDDMYIIVSHSLDNVGLTDPDVFVFTGCDGAYNVGLDEFLNRLSGGVPSVSFFNSLQLSDFHISYANSSFSVPDSTLQSIGVPTGCLVPQEESGFQYLFDFVISSTRYQWAFTYNNGVLEFKPASPALEGTAPAKATLSNMFSLITKNVITPSMVSLLNQQDLSNLPVQSIVVDRANKICNITVEPSSTELIVLVRGSVEVSSIKIVYQLKLDSNADKDIEDMKFITVGGFRFVGINFDVEITVKADGSYFMRACSDFYLGGLSGMLVALNPAFVILPLMEAIGVLQVGLIYPCIEATFQPNMYPSSFCVASDLARSSLATVRGTACIDYGNVYYLGLEIKDFIMATPLTSFVGALAGQSPFLTTKANAAVVEVSSAASSLPMSSMLYDELVNHYGGALEGITFYGIIGWPDSCSSNSFCKIMYDLLGPNTIFFLFSYMQHDLLHIYVEAGLKNFMLGDIPMAYASLFMEYNVDEDTADVSYVLGVQAAIIITLDPPNDNLTLHGLIQVEFPKPAVTVEFAMQGCWSRAFGIPILDICNIFLAVTLTPGVPYPTGGAFGMQIKIGDPKCFRFEATGYVRIDTTDPSNANNYVYVVVSTPATLQSFLDFLCTGVQLPTFLGEHGFPEGFSLTYANGDVVIPQLVLFIPQGLVFNGTISWYGVKVAVYLYVNLPDVIEAKGELFPMTLAGGLLKMYKSRSEKEKGPFLSIVMRTNPLPAFKVEASGYASVLGIEAEVTLYFNPAGFELYMYGNIFNILEANMRIYASTGSIYNAEFGIEANLTIGLFKAIEDGVVAFLRGAADAAEAAISAPQEALRLAQRGFDLLNEGFRKAQSAVQGARHDLSSARSEISNLRHTLDHVICRYRTCGDVCVPFLCPCGCAKKVWGACVWPCLRFDSCCFKVPDPACLLYNAGCFIIRSPFELALLAAQGILLIAEAALLVVEAALAVAQLAVEAAKLVLEAAILVLEGIKQLFKFALQALEAIAKFLLTGLIDIRAMGFDVKLSLMSHGHIRAWADISFLSSAPVHFEFTLPIFNPLALIADFAEMAIPGIGRKKRAMRRLDKVYWLASNFRNTGSIYPKASRM